MSGKIVPLHQTIIPQKKAGRKKSLELSDPVVQNKLSKAVETGRLKNRTENITSIRAMLQTTEIREAMEDIINMSAMSNPLKVFIKSVFLEQDTKKKAIKKAFGKDLGYQEEMISRGVMEQKGVKEFIAVLKQFYLQVAPIAMLKEVDIMLNPLTDAKVALQASMDIQNRAMPQAIKTNTAPPVTVIINTPQNGNTLTQVNNQNE